MSADAGFPESQKGSQTYGTAWPLHENYYLCAYEPVEVKGVSQRHVFGLYLLDKFGNKELIYRDPGIACLSPMPLRASTTPPVIPEPPLCPGCATWLLGRPQRAAPRPRPRTAAAGPDGRSLERLPVLPSEPAR